MRQQTLNAFTILRYVLGILITLVTLFPIYWMIISSLKSSQELLQAVPSLWPKEFHWNNYSDVWQKAPFGRYFFNTGVTTAGVLILELFTGILAAYGFSKGKFKGRNFLFMVVLGAMMVPAQVTFVPLYVMMSQFNRLNTFAGLIIPNAVSAYLIFMLRQAFMAVDDSYLEAAKMDGLGRFGIIFQILCPMCKPTLITVGVIQFIDNWNAYFWPKMITNDINMRTIAVGVANLKESYAGLETMNTNQIMAGAFMAIVPIILVFVFLQKYILTGMSKAAMK